MSLHIADLDEAVDTLTDEMRRGTTMSQRQAQRNQRFGYGVHKMDRVPTAI